MWRYFVSPQGPGSCVIAQLMLFLHVLLHPSLPCLYQELYWLKHAVSWCAYLSKITLSCVRHNYLAVLTSCSCFFSVRFFVHQYLVLCHTSLFASCIAYYVLYFLLHLSSSYPVSLLGSFLLMSFVCMLLYLFLYIPIRHNMV